jgi:ribosomal-protein-alanine N-acetyltransferase
MKKYSTNNELIEMRCNKCGKVLRVENGVLKEGAFSTEVCFGYFSSKDGQKHEVDLCEDCYDAWTREFEIPVKVCEQTELL